MNFKFSDLPTGDLSEMAREWQPSAEIWIPAIRRAVQKLGGQECDVLIVWEKIAGEMTVRQLETLIQEVVCS